MATLEQLQEELTKAKAARESILNAQEYNTGEYSVRKADLRVLNNHIRELETRIAILKNKGRLNHGQAIFGGQRG